MNHDKTPWFNPKQVDNHPGFDQAYLAVWTNFCARARAGGWISAKRRSGSDSGGVRPLATEMHNESQESSQI
jgi:hypothetical protein